MYIFPEMINMGLKEGEEWTSETHKIVAQRVLLMNPRITQRDHLVDGVSIINNLEDEQIVKITLEQLEEMGCPGI